MVEIQPIVLIYVFLTAFLKFASDVQVVNLLKCSTDMPLKYSFEDEHINYCQD